MADNAHLHGSVKTGRVEDTRSSDETLGCGELGLEVRLNLCGVVVEGRAVVKSLISCECLGDGGGQSHERCCSDHFGKTFVSGKSIRVPKMRMVGGSKDDCVANGIQKRSTEDGLFRGLDCITIRLK